VQLLFRYTEAAPVTGDFPAGGTGQRAYFANGSPTYVRCVMADFDERPRYPILVPNAADINYFPDHTLDRYRQAVRNLAADLAESTRTSVVDNFVLVYAWNEWHEGGYIEPNGRDGCAYLIILREELGLRSGAGCVANPTG
jgi:hypothetical protein